MLQLSIKHRRSIYILIGVLGFLLSALFAFVDYEKEVNYKKTVFEFKAKQRINNVETQINAAVLDVEMFAERLVEQGIYYEEGFFNIAEKVQKHIPYIRGFYFAYKNVSGDYKFDYAWPVDHRTQEVLGVLNNNHFLEDIDFNKILSYRLSKSYVLKHRSNNTGAFLIVPLKNLQDTEINDGILIAEIVWNDLLMYTFKGLEPAHMHYNIQVDDDSNTEHYYISRSLPVISYGSTAFLQGKPMDFKLDQIFHIGGRKIKVRAESLDYGHYYVSPFTGISLFLMGIFFTAFIIFFLRLSIAKSQGLSGYAQMKIKVLENRLDSLKTLLADNDIQASLDKIVESVEGRDLKIQAAIHLINEDGVVEQVSCASLGLMYKEAFLKRNLKEGDYKASAFYHTKRHVSVDLLYDPSWHAYKKMVSYFKLHSCWSIPLYSDAYGLVGILTVYVRDKYAMDKENLAFFDEISELIISVVDIFKNNQERDRIYGRYKTIAEGNSNISMIFDEAFRFQYVTPAFLDALKGEPSDFIGKSFTQGLPESEYARIESFMNEVVSKSGKSVCFEVYPKTMDDESRISFKCTMTYLPDVLGVNGILCDLEDISERKALEASLLETKHNLSGIIENIPGVVFKYTYNSAFKFIETNYMSNSIENYTGEDKNNFLGEKPLYKIEDFINEDDVIHVKQTLFEAIEKSSSFECPFRFLDQNGNESHMLMMGRASVSPKLNDERVIEGVMMDNTKGVLAQKRFEDIEIILKETFNKTPETFYRLKMDDNYTLNFLSENVYNLLGYKSSEFIGQGGTLSAKGIMDLNTSSTVERNVDDALSTGGKYSYFLRLVHKEGFPVWVENSGTILQDKEKEEFISDGLLRKLSDHQSEALERDYQLKLLPTSADKDDENKDKSAKKTSVKEKSKTVKPAKKSANKTVKIEKKTKEKATIKAVDKKTSVKKLKKQ